ncbi:peptidylprolyl isomerase [Paenibacillus sp. J5C_2022]|uniref:peptidylprolyl isomerase n=1 Tax=Paenibacillus sp. J5C2022 TaxID=2977129 RepID=UPI0021CE0B78|nr:peptidylprolyl isomerase [Paenibacillus sp. J5C2022]MCU6712778.1 peptidylprolyl isomerase [Paenibacillus sp. J5C2022]
MNNKDSLNNENKGDQADEQSVKKERYTYEEETGPAAGQPALSEEEKETDKHHPEDEVAAASAIAAAPAIPAEPPAPVVKKSPWGWILLSAALVVALAVVIVKPPFGADNSNVATVNGTNIKKEDLYEFMVKRYGAATLDNMITEELVRQEADAASVAITDEDVTNQLEALKLSFPSQEVFDMQLMQAGITEEQLRDDMRMQTLLIKLLEPQTDVTDEEVQQYFDQNKATWSTPEQIRASHILVETEEEAKAIVAELEGGADFGELAKEKSKDEGSAVAGGDLNFFGRGQMVKEFEDAAFALEVNEVSDIVQSSFGYHIIKKTDSKAASEPVFEEKKEAIRTMLLTQEANPLSNAWLQEKREKAVISNTLEEESEAAEKAGSESNESSDTSAE